MANALYTLFKKALLDSSSASTTFSLDTSNIRAVLTDHGTDTPVVATDDFLDDISTGTVETNDAAFTTTTTTGGAFDADDLTGATKFTTVSGATCESLNIYIDSGAAATSWLVLYIDTATGLPLTPNGGDVTVTCGTNIFSLS